MTLKRPGSTKFASVAASLNVSDPELRRVLRALFAPENLADPLVFDAKGRFSIDMVALAQGLARMESQAAPTPSSLVVGSASLGQSSSGGGLPPATPSATASDDALTAIHLLWLGGL